MHPAKSKLYYSLIALSFGYSACTLEAGFYKSALERHDDLDMLQATCISKIKSYNDQIADIEKNNQNNPERIKQLQNKILLFTARNEKINEIRESTQGLGSPLEEHYVMLKTVEVPSVTSENTKEEVKEGEVKSSPPAVKVEDDKPYLDWEVFSKEPGIRSILWSEAYYFAHAKKSQLPAIQEVLDAKPVKDKNDFKRYLHRIGRALEEVAQKNSIMKEIVKDPYETAFNNLLIVIQNSSNLDSFPSEFDWQNYPGVVRGTYSKYNNIVRELFIKELNTTVKDRHIKKK